MTMNKAHISDQGGSSRSDMVSDSFSDTDLLKELGEYAMSLGDKVNKDVLTDLVADISEMWTPGCGGMSKKVVEVDSGYNTTINRFGGGVPRCKVELNTSAE